MNDVFMKNFHRLPVVFTGGEGACLFDKDGKKYLDFSSGIAVNCLGHHYPPLVRAIAEQAAKCCHVSNYYQTDTAALFAEKLVAACAPAGMKSLFLGNSGAEANEAACKIARKYSLKKYGPDRHTIVTLQGSFHGRTITMLAATGQDSFHKDFGPFTEGFTYIPGGDIAALDKALDKTVAGLLIEAVQGESGIRPQSQEFIEAAARLCAERDILLMFDEIQCGLGRTGTFLALEQYRYNGKPVQADVVTIAKGLAGGIPAGAVLAGEKAAGVFETGDHNSTFGGNPVAAAAGLVVLETVDNPGFLAEIARKGEAIMAAIKAWNHPSVQEVRGRGLMIGIDIDKDAWPILEAGLALERQGLLLLSAGQKTLRLLPPYTIRDSEIEQGLEILKGLL
ncbi:MAG: acetylornithine/succinylornithine family transaminase [Treponema sp.]|nr:acetylornithine/succinylornithine family transaminase [Treponema sp.]